MLDMAGELGVLSSVVLRFSQQQQQERQQQQQQQRRQRQASDAPVGGDGEAGKAWPAQRVSEPPLRWGGERGGGGGEAQRRAATAQAASVSDGGGSGGAPASEGAAAAGAAHPGGLFTSAADMLTAAGLGQGLSYRSLLAEAAEAEGEGGAALLETLPSGDAGAPPTATLPQQRRLPSDGDDALPPGGATLTEG